MIRTLFINIALLFSMIMNGQTILFFEDFENTSSLTVTSSGIPGWSISTTMSASGLRSDSATCLNAQDSSVLSTTATINTTGYGFVMLEFDHICKIEFYDAAYIEVSANGGVSWIRLTGAHYLGAGQFANSGNKFNSTSYPDWLPGNPSPPQNSWWKHEYFDISSIAANAAQVLVRFILKDENNQSILDNYAWFIDNIKITGALSELTPPSITLVPPVLQGFKFSLGPFPISAIITDTSGVDTAWVICRVNHGAWDSLPMSNVAGNTWLANIPPVNDLDTIDYFLVAIDGSVSQNAGYNPQSGYITVVASSGLYTPYFNDFEVLDSLWVPVTTSPLTEWQHGYPNYGLLTGAFSGTNAWTVNKDSLHGNNATATLTSPYFNFFQATDLVLSFWQNRNTESAWDGMHMEYTLDELNWYILGALNDPAGENWYTDTIYATSGGPAWEGNSGGWIKSSYRLGFLNNMPMVRFRFVFSADPFVTYEGVSIDNFAIYPTPDVDVALKSVVAPVTGCQLGMEIVTVQIRNEGLDTLSSIPMNYFVAGAVQPVTEIFNDTLLPDSSAIFSFSNLLDMTASGKDSVFRISVYSSLASDTMRYNDTIALEVISGSIPTDPIPLHQTIPYAASTKITALSSDTLFWFAHETGGQLIHIGDTLQTPLLFDSTTYWVEARAGIGELRFTELTFESTGAGCSNPYPSYIPPSTQWDGVEITNTGSSSVDLTGFIFHMEGFKTVDYPLPEGVVLMPGEIIILSIFASPVIPPDTTNNFYIVAGNLSIFSNSQIGFWLEAPDGSVEDAFAINGYSFGTGSPVTPAHWSGAIPMGTGKAGVIRVYSNSNTASDWVLSDLPAPIQSIGTYNPQLDPVTSLGCPGNRMPLNIHMSSYPPIDAGIIDVPEPVTKTGLTSGEFIKVVAKNFGTQPISGFTLAVQLSGNAPVSEIYADTLFPGDTVHYSFATTFDMASYQNYQIKSWTELVGDTVPLNDTITVSVDHLLPAYCTSAAQFTSLGDIGLVEFGSLVNHSATGAKTYTDFTHLAPQSFIQGLSYPISITAQSQSSYNYVYGIKVFIDLDGDGLFDPATETVFSGLTTSSNNTVTGSVTMPYGAATGYARMRVVMSYGSSLTSVLPCGSYNYGETEDYTIIILPRLAFDAGVVGVASFLPPLIEGTNQSITAWVKNLGSDTIANFQAGWMIAGQNPIIETLSLTLAPGDSTIHLFSAPLTVPFGIIQLKVFADLFDDQFRGNDTLTVNLLGEKDFTPLFFDDFERDDTNGWFSEMEALWQHGKPAATVINYAHSPTRVWTTRLLGNYLHNVQKGLVSPEFNFVNFSGLSLRFWHWYETEYGLDGGSVKYSNNGGATFITLGYIGDPMGVNWYNANASGKFSFSGFSGGWVYSSYDLSAFDNHPTPVSFKFDFFSNNSIAYNGWAIDDFMITVEKAEIDAGVTEIILPASTVPQGATFQVAVRIKNFGKVALTSIPVAFTINSGIDIQDVWTGVLQPGNTVVFTMSPLATSTGYMELKAFTQVPGDLYLFNNAATKVIGNVGIVSHSDEIEFSVTPNPADDRIYLNVKLQEPADAYLSIVDMAGRLVIDRQYSWNAGEQREEVVLSGIRPGVYQLTLKTKFGRSLARIIVR